MRPLPLTRSGSRRPLGALVLSVVGVAVMAVPLLAMEDLSQILAERVAEIPAEPRAYRETWMLPAEGTVAASVDDTEIVARAAVAQLDGDELVEIQRFRSDGLDEAATILCDDGRWYLRTPMADSPILETALREDPLARMVLAGPPGEAPRTRTLTDDQGALRAVVLREVLDHPVTADDFARREGPMEADEGLLAELRGIDPLRGDRQPVASAAPKGVEEIETYDGKVRVVPDPQGVEWMESFALSVPEFERFRREMRLPPYDALPPVTVTAKEGS